MKFVNNLDWMPLVIAIITVLGAAGVYAYQRRVDRKNSLLEKRREIYVNYVLAVQKDLVGVKDPVEYQAALVSTFIYGPDAVARAVNGFHDSVADKVGKVDGPTVAEAYANMVLAMRADCFATSRLSAEELKQFLPFKF